jgi:hypothetical protein
MISALEKVSLNKKIVPYFCVMINVATLVSVRSASARTTAEEARG